MENNILFLHFLREKIYIFFRAEAARAASEKKLLQLLTELVQTERKYVLDLEEVREDTHKKKYFVSGWTAKKEGGGEKNPLSH